VALSGAVTVCTRHSAATPQHHLWMTTRFFIMSDDSGFVYDVRISSPFSALGLGFQQSQHKQPIREAEEKVWRTKRARRAMEHWKKRKLPPLLET
jgi:hypothetical protein